MSNSPPNGKSRAHDPSPSSSHVSLSVLGGIPPAAFPPRVTGRSHAQRAGTTNTTTTATTTDTTVGTTTATASGSGSGPGPAAIPGPGPLTIPPLPRRESTRTSDRSDALWAEMQATLEAVELSAGGGAGGSRNRNGSRNGSVSGGGTGGGTGAARTRVFGPDHERKLDELRTAQIALAQAWARSEADEAIGAGSAGGGGAGAGAGAGVEPPAAAAALSEGRSAVTDGVGGTGGGGGVIGVGGKSTVGTGSAARPASSGLGGQQERFAPHNATMEEETEVDILLARKRREANDRYFQRVNQGVLDVVAKLEDVAIAMRAVEKESKDLWGDENESAPASAKG